MLQIPLRLKFREVRVPEVVTGSTVVTNAQETRGRPHDVRSAPLLVKYKPVAKQLHRPTVRYIQSHRGRHLNLKLDEGNPRNVFFVSL